MYAASLDPVPSITTYYYSKEIETGITYYERKYPKAAATSANLGVLSC